MTTRRLLAVTLSVAALLAACSASPSLAERPAGLPSASPGSAPSSQVLLDKRETTVLDQPLAYPTASPAQVTSAIITLMPGQETGPHKHEVPLYGYILEGTLTVTYDGGVVKQYPAGTAFMEAVGTQHNGSNQGLVPVRILATYIGAAGAANTVKL